MDPDIQVADFDMRKLCNRYGATCVILGARGLGKSTMIKDILYHLHHIGRVPRAVVFSGTEKANGTYSSFGIPSRYIFDTYDADALQTIYNMQEKLTEDKRKGIVPESLDIRMVLVFDDCGFDEKIFRTTLMRQLFMNGRHYGIYVIIALQYHMSVPPTIRTQIDFFISTRWDTKPQRKQIHTHYASVYNDFETFNDVMEAATVNRRCMIVDKVTDSPDPQDKLFSYKARIGLRCKFGSAAYRKYAKYGSGKMESMVKAVNTAAGTRRRVKIKTS